MTKQQKMITLLDVAMNGDPSGVCVTNADIVPGKSIRLYGSVYGDNFDVTFNVGGEAVYDSFNLIYTGTIKSITAKTVTVIEPYSCNPKTRRLSIYKFAWRNRRYNAEDIKRRNDEVSRCI